MYIAEISPADLRGMLVSAKEGIIVLGMVGGFVAGAVFSEVEIYGWRLMAAVNIIFALTQGIGISFVPDSPRWLVLQGSGVDVTRAREALMFFREAEDVSAELDAIKEDATSVSRGSGSARGSFEAFDYPRPLIIACGLVTLQQVTGQPSVLYYATNIFKAAGFAGAAATLSSVGIGVVKLFATLVSVALVERYGRRPLLFVGIGLMAISLLVLSISMRHRYCEGGGPAESCEQDRIAMPQGAAITMVCALMVYVSGYQVGFGPIAWLMISEVFPLTVRGSAISIAALTNFIFNIVMTVSQGVMMDSLQPTGVFLLYFFLALVSLIFVYGIVPETKGKTLEEISADMGSSGQTPGLTLQRQDTESS
jgi:sugar porter (SP) family MFS transporter